MNKVQPRTLKGFRDFLPEEARRRQYVIEKLKAVFESYGFDPLETPSLEYAEILTGKYGTEGDKLMYRFTDNGGREVALRYDQTVPLARVIAQYKDKLPLPFKRYQIQNVWRAENTQRGRFREFLQCDIDIAGIDSTIADAEIIAIVYNSLYSLGINDFKILINDRSTFKDIPKEAIPVIDKLKKIGETGVISELKEKGLDENILEKVRSSAPSGRLKDVIKKLEEFDIDGESYKFDPTLARGMDYYTGLIIEVEVENYSGGSIGGGGRYDELVGLFSKTAIPAVGFSFGFDRLMDALTELDLFPELVNKTEILVTIFSPENEIDSINLYNALRKEGRNVEIYPDANTKIEKQLKYADQKDISYALIIGSEEKKDSKITVKNLKSREQKTLTLDELVEELAK